MLLRHITRNSGVHRALANTASSSLLASSSSALSSAAASSSVVLPSTSSLSSAVLCARHFARGAASTDKKSAKKSSSEGDEPKLILDGYKYDEFNIVPPIPKPKYEELVSACLTEEQLRFAKRPMPDSATREATIPAIYIGPKLVGEHTEADVGKYYTVSDQILKLMPTCIHRSMSQEYMGGGQYHMIRNPGFELVNSLKIINSANNEVNTNSNTRAITAGTASSSSTESSSSATKPTTTSTQVDLKALKSKLPQRVFGIRGESGCGKSASLHYAIQYIRECNIRNPKKPWLLIATRGEEFALETKGFIQPSNFKAGIYDQALYTMEFFTNLLKTESEALKKITLKRKVLYGDINWGEKTGETLYDLALLASTDREQAPRLLYDFTGELKHATEVPVLVVIDNMNVWDQVCDFIEPLTYQNMDPRKLALVDAFSYFAERAPANGATIWSLTTRYATLDKAFTHFNRRTVKGLDAWWYNIRELKACIVHYSVSEFILSEITTDLIKRINGLTGKVPRDVFKQAFLR